MIQVILEMHFLLDIVRVGNMNKKYNEIKNQLFTTGYIKIENWLQDNFDNVDAACLNGKDTTDIIKNKEEIDGIEVFREVEQDEHLAYKHIFNKFWSRSQFHGGEVHPFGKGSLTNIKQHLDSFIVSLYGPEMNIFYIDSSSHIQYYPPGSFISSHSDALDERIASSFVFLSDKNGEGGELVLVGRNGEKIVYEPSFGDLIVLDMLKGEGITHQVTEVKWDTRFVLVTFSSPYNISGSTVKKIL